MANSEAEPKYLGPIDIDVTLDPESLELALQSSNREGNLGFIALTLSTITWQNPATNEFERGHFKDGHTAAHFEVHDISRELTERNSIKRHNANESGYHTKRDRIAVLGAFSGQTLDDTAFPEGSTFGYGRAAMRVFQPNFSHVEVKGIVQIPLWLPASAE
ncbi:MAG TPA: hypothetical protein VG992_03620 [Candidatus Saccharimonadales bacterium]|nr:hypothetical protein [Candidatus Saccharimonadales bacterium]